MSTNLVLMVGKRVLDPQVVVNPRGFGGYVTGPKFIYTKRGGAGRGGENGGAGWVQKTEAMMP